jgi:hypothetical protein
MVSFADRAEVLPHVLVRFLDKESVLLNLETERYFGLDETGTRMWQVVTAAPSIDAAYQELQNEFDVESELLRLHAGAHGARTFSARGCFAATDIFKLVVAWIPQDANISAKISFNLWQRR